MRRRLPGWVLVLMLLTASHAQAMAVDAVTLEDPALEARARLLMQGFRCLVCQNQSIEISDAELAGDLRRIVRERIAAGDTDEQVRAHLVARYGDWVVMRPPVKPSTLILWGGPPVLLIVGGLALWMAQRKRKNLAGPPPLTEAEKLQLHLLSGSD